MATFVATRFGSSLLSPSIMFLQTNFSCAFTNIKPIVPGRILVAFYNGVAVVTCMHTSSSYITK